MAHIPYGYKIEKGKAVPDKIKASQVKNLFNEYLKGSALQSAAKASGIHLSHASIGRILDNRVYLGDGFYPALVSENIWNKVQNERKRRADALGRNKNYFSEDKSNISPFWDKVFCAGCGNVYRRYSDEGKNLWKCVGRMAKDKLCDNSLMIPETILEEVFMRIVRGLDIPSVAEAPDSQKPAIDRKYDDPFKQAEYAYSQTPIDDFDYQTQKLLAALQKIPVGFDGDFMRKVIKRIEVSNNKTAVFVLINNKRFGEELISNAKP